MASIIPITGTPESKLAKLFAELYEADIEFKAAERRRKAAQAAIQELGIASGTVAGAEGIGAYLLEIKESLCCSLDTTRIKAEMPPLWVAEHSKTNVRRSISVARIKRAALSA